MSWTHFRVKTYHSVASISVAIFFLAITICQKLGRTSFSHQPSRPKFETRHAGEANGYPLVEWSLSLGDLECDWFLSQYNMMA
jgi:hypothetical protein